MLAISSSKKENLFVNFIDQSKHRVEKVLETILPPLDQQSYTLNSAIRYAVLGGGKRIRAAIIYSVENTFNISTSVSDQMAAAIEILHASSLVHDDLPALDNDSLRRGKAACHIMFGEAIAILTGDALLNLTYQTVSMIPDHLLSAEKRIHIVRIFGHAIGHNGLIKGQSLEFSQDQSPLSKQEIEELYYLKTGKLFGCSLQSMLIASNHYEPVLFSMIDELSYHIGIAFQIGDDLLDIHGDTKLIGKPTLIEKLGIEDATLKMHYHQAKAHECLKQTKLDFSELHQLIDYIILRRY